MKNLLKTLALLIAAVMVMSLFAACSDKPEDTTTAKPDTTAAEGTEKETETVSGTETETETETATEEVTETDAETTEKPEEKRYDVYRWDFNDASDLGWVASNMTELTAEEDGSVHFKVKGGDPHVSTKKITANIDCGKVEYIEIRLKNNTNSDAGQIFISTTDSPGPNENYSIKYVYEYMEGDDEWEILEIDTLDINGWTGTLRSLRFDYTEGGEGDFYVDYIALQTTNEADAGATEAETEVDPRAGKEVLYKWDFTTLKPEDMYLSSQAGDETEEEDESGEDEDEHEHRWRFSNGVEDAYVENNHFVVKVGGQDPFIVTPFMTDPFACDAVSAIVIKVCNKTDMLMGQLFFTTDGSEFSEAASVKFTYDHSGADNDEWEEIVINPKEAGDYWTGQLEYIRIDPTESHDGIVLLDYCLLYG